MESSGRCAKPNLEAAAAFCPHRGWWCRAQQCDGDPAQAHPLASFPGSGDGQPDLAQNAQVMRSENPWAHENPVWQVSEPETAAPLCLSHSALQATTSVSIKKNTKHEEKKNHKQNSPNPDPFFTNSQTLLFPRKKKKKIRCCGTTTGGMPSNS